MFKKTFESVGDFNNPTYRSPVARSWNHKVAEADAFVAIASEYDHSARAVGRRTPLTACFTNDGTVTG